MCAVFIIILLCIFCLFFVVSRSLSMAYFDDGVRPFAAGERDASTSANGGYVAVQGPRGRSLRDYDWSSARPCSVVAEMRAVRPPPPWNGENRNGLETAGADSAGRWSCCCGGRCRRHNRR